MLVLSRQRDQTIMIGDSIEVTVVDIRGDKVRLGITAPREVGVHRKEVYEAIRRENRAAAQVKPSSLPGHSLRTGPATAATVAEAVDKVRSGQGPQTADVVAAPAEGGRHVG